MAPNTMRTASSNTSSIAFIPWPNIGQTHPLMIGFRHFRWFGVTAIMATDKGNRASFLFVAPPDRGHTVGRASHLGAPDAH